MKAELDRTVAVAQNSLPARQVAHNERRALIGGEAASKTSHSNGFLL
jgi:hypothetical protein